MKGPTLVIMAAGIGSRFGGGIKQLEAMGPNGEIIMDYSIYDAKQAGFERVVFVIRKEIEDDFKEVIGNRIKKKIRVEYVFQELDEISAAYRGRFPERTKPWGTGQAILCCRDVINEPFLVINADDYYGKEAYRRAYEYLMKQRRESDRLQMAMVGFVLSNTLSDHGAVTRGICRVDDKHMLTEIRETRNIIRTEEGAAVDKGDHLEALDMDSPVSMNMWAFYPEIFPVLETEFHHFLEERVPKDASAEYLLPEIVGDLLSQGKAEVDVLQSGDRWFGVTYKEDKELVVREIQKLLDQGLYPDM